MQTSSAGWDCNHSTDEHQDHGAFLYQLYEANKESDHIFEFISKISAILCNTCKFTILVLSRHVSAIF